MTRAYLESSEHIDCREEAVCSKATELSSGSSDDEVIARRCFEFVRDEIRHSWDARENPVTCRASDVLQHATGFCYAKSHLLAALLRANGIPAGLCYQRLRLDSGGFCLHGLNAIYLERYGWYRVDPRGNRGEIAAEFRPPQEKLAFSIAADGEADLPGIWPEPLPVVVEALDRAGSFRALAANLPDCQPQQLGEVICDY
ncbi:transglutaminase-like domain-containing protein [Microbulbifer halophilus]|uniref:Transglutaminase family protein n=1 Tax=Microbulbifer halophilus TaxID=453963 RepID=A0ABW5EAY5_9GAMM|nr:transglutaminase family protein [Microbulbifer halophilus]MCW8126085.1 transglutaminase family protein [Microbulbifer halophilus]